MNALLRLHINCQVKREFKAASREIRRDSQFLARARNQDSEVDAGRCQILLHRPFSTVFTAFRSLCIPAGSRQNERRKNLVWMEEQQAAFNQQVKAGGDLTGGGSSIKKTAARVLKTGRRL